MIYSSLACNWKAIAQKGVLHTLFFSAGIQVCNLFFRCVCDEKRSFVVFRTSLFQFVFGNLTGSADANSTTIASINSNTAEISGNRSSTRAVRTHAANQPVRIELRAINSYVQIVAWLEYLPSKYPFVEIQNLGRTFENRSLLIVKVISQRNLAN